jgi:hypothetical protein
MEASIGNREEAAADKRMEASICLRGEATTAERTEACAQRWVVYRLAREFAAGEHIEASARRGVLRRPTC